MTCLKDLAECHFTGSMGYCCSQHCVQSEGQPKGYCRESTVTTTATSPVSPRQNKSTANKPPFRCLKENSPCQPDGSLGTCCSAFCSKLQTDKVGKCVGTSAPANIPAQCLDGGERCKADSSLGICCSGFCKVLWPHTEGRCNGTSRATPHSSGNAWIIYTSVSLGLFAVLIVAFLWLYLRQRKLEKGLSKKETDHFFNGDPEMMHLNNKYAHESTDFMPYNKELEIDARDFILDWENPLGQGAYGLVLKGILTDTMNVAVKTLKSNQAPETTSHLRALLGEIKVLQHIGKHENIVSLIGCHTGKLREGKVFVLLEYCSMGSLEKYLRANKYHFVEIQPRAHSYVNVQGSPDPEAETALHNITKTDLLTWSLQITSGMHYLEEKKVIHADLATRNVLLLRKDCVKITDFGLSRRLYEYSNYVKKNQEPLPWRWMALESLQQLEFSHKSDVWSLGVTIWEIFSLGDVPYPGLTWTVEFVSSLENGLRPQKPTTASEKIYEIILDCWKSMPELRPKFGQIYERLEECQALHRSGKLT